MRKPPALQETEAAMIGVVKAFDRTPLALTRVPARPSTLRIVTGYYSVHTSQAALREGEKNIAAIGKRLHNQGVIGQ
jgi:hypothetical protein